MTEPSWSYSETAFILVALFAGYYFLRGLLSAIGEGSSRGPDVQNEDRD